MLSTDVLPTEFASLAGSIAYVRQITTNEFHASCPRCHGEIHEDGSYPDRFVLWIASRRGTPFGLCRKCGYKWTPSKEDVKWTDEEKEEFRQKITQLEQAYYATKADLRQAWLLYSIHHAEHFLCAGATPNAQRAR